MRFAPFVVVLLVLTAGGRHDAILPADISSPGDAATYAEPAAVAAFVAAYARGDEATAERVASPLYGAEWARWGLTIQERAQLLPHRRTWWGTPAAWLRLSYVGGAVDRRGFGHLLFTAQPAGGEVRGAPGVWRIDTDPQGRVIWSELVWHFSERSSVARSVAEGPGAASAPMPALLAARAPQVLVGIRTGVGPEGYYAVEYHGGPADDAGGTPETAVVCYGIDEDGAFWPGAWSYGQAHPGQNAYDGVPRPTRPTPLGRVPEALRAAYLDDL